MHNCHSPWLYTRDLRHCLWFYRNMVGCIIISARASYFFPLRYEIKSANETQNSWINFSSPRVNRLQPKSPCDPAICTAKCQTRAHENPMASWMTTGPTHWRSMWNINNVLFCTLFVHPDPCDPLFTQSLLIFACSLGSSCSRGDLYSNGGRCLSNLQDDWKLVRRERGEVLCRHYLPIPNEKSCSVLCQSPLRLPKQLSDGTGYGGVLACVLYLRSAG